MQRVKHRQGCDCCECGTIHAIVRLCSDSSNISGATVTVFDSLGNEVGSAVTSGAGTADVGFPSAATYTIRVEKAGLATLTFDRAVTCTTNSVLITMGRVLNITVGDCSANAGAGVVVVATLSGATYTATTNSSGVAQIAVPATGSFSVTATHSSSRFTPTSATVVLSGCSVSATINLVPASGYVCVAWGASGCDLPVATTLFATDSLHGAVTLTYNPAFFQWEGSKSVNFPACGGCIAVTQTLLYALSASNLAPTTTDVGTRVYRQSTTRSRTTAPFTNCLGTDAEPGVAQNPLTFRLASRTCPPSFLFTSTSIGFDSADCLATNSTITFTE